jgi:predicted Ser/Thr protein kinase
MNGSLQLGTLLARRYRVLAQIGVGGFGTVYKARDRRQHSKLVAIKEINMAALSSQEKIEVTDSFNREITLLSRLEHKHLPRIYDQCTDPEHWYIVMDYIEGQTLEELLARSPKGRLSVNQVAKIGIALCDVLAHLHNQSPSIIYRDVKPSNIMITPWGRLYLIDFGIARRYRPGQQRDTGPLGSPGYAAPEQYGRMQTTVQTDIYGLGVTLQTLLTGKEPLDIRLQGMPPDVRLPWKLQALLTRMMNPDPFKRPQSMIEVKAVLTPYVTSWQPWLYMMGLGFSSMGMSGFSDSPFVGPYLYLVLALMVIPCIYALLRAWRIAQVGLSAKAATIIIGKQLFFSLALVSALSLGISVLYALLVQHQFSLGYLSLLWLYGILSIVIVLILLISWLKRVYWMRQPRRAPAQSQALPLLQQRRKRP